VTTRLVVALTCDVCNAQARPRFPTPAAADTWMRRHGWASRYYADWCPACLLLDGLEQMRESTSTPTTDDQPGG
jgi:hypothetical protein